MYMYIFNVTYFYSSPCLSRVNIVNLPKTIYFTLAITEIKQKSNVTPGVRRTKRPNISRVLEYNKHLGNTPSNTYGKILIEDIYCQYSISTYNLLFGIVYVVTCTKNK